jgi:fructose-1,6-bisphosphatase II
MPPIRGVRDTENPPPLPARRRCRRSISSDSSGLEFIRATEAGALSAYKWMGKGDKESADYAACDAIRGLFDT